MNASIDWMKVHTLTRHTLLETIKKLQRQAFIDQKTIIDLKQDLQGTLATVDKLTKKKKGAGRAIQKRISKLTKRAKTRNGGK